MTPENDPKIESIRSRFAPSPTGLLHLGSARTALFAFLFARKNQGTFILRIEDTDKERSKKEYEQDIIEDLKWLGLDWDEGPDKDGPFGPYRQSERMEIYEKYLNRLLKENKAYYCFCPEQELEAQRQYQLSQGQPAVYSGQCRDLSEEQVKENLRQGKSAIIRFRNETGETVIFEDLIRGKIEFDPKLIGDFPIAKSINSPLWNFSVTVDDFEMKITHVIRGEEHISNTPKQAMLQKALGFNELRYGHLPMILAPDRSKLSKRHGSVPVRYYKQEGYLPETLVNFLVLLGWHPQEEKELFSLNGLAKEFSLERVQKSAAIFNQQRLDWFNGYYLRNLSLEKLTEQCLPFLIKAGLISIVQESVPPQLLETPGAVFWQEQKYKVKDTEEEIDFQKISKIVSLYQERLKKLSEIVDLTDYFFKNKIEFDAKTLLWKQMSLDQARGVLTKLETILGKIENENWSRENLETVLLAEAEKICSEFSAGADRGYLLWPLRVAITGKQASAGPFEVAEVLGKQKVLNRIKQASGILRFIKQ